MKEMIGHRAELIHGNFNGAVGKADTVAVRVNDCADF